MLAFDKTAAESEPETTGYLWWDVGTSSSCVCDDRTRWHGTRTRTLPLDNTEQAGWPCASHRDTVSVVGIQDLYSILTSSSFEMLKAFFMFSFSLVVWECFLWIGRFRKRIDYIWFIVKFFLSPPQICTVEAEKSLCFIVLNMMVVFGVCGSASGEQCFFFSTLLFLFHPRWSRFPLQLWPLWLTEG